MRRMLSIAFILIPAACALFGAEPQTFDSNGVSIHYTVEGKGEPVVLIHGLYSSADINWRLTGTVAQLAENHQVITLDVRGHGQSGKPTDEHAYGTEMVEDVVRLMAHLKLEKAHVAGYSMGGMIAMKLAVLHPEKVKSLALCGMGWLKSGSFLADFWSKLPGNRGRENGVGTPAVCPKSFSQLAVSEDDIKGLKMPAIAIVGSSDPVKGLYVAPLSKIRPDWSVVEIPGAGHISCVANAKFKSELKNWLDKPELK